MKGEVFTLYEVSQLAGVSYETVIGWAASGSLKIDKEGMVLVVRDEDLRNFLNAEEHIA